MEKNKNTYKKIDKRKKKKDRYMERKIDRKKIYVQRDL